MKNYILHSLGVYSLMFCVCLILCLPFKIQLDKQIQQKEKEQAIYNLQKSLPVGVSGNLSVKLTTYEFDGEGFLTNEKTLKNIQWGKIELIPSIGSVPTFVYIEAGKSEIKRIHCSFAKII